jgi:hypothetical protein
MNAFWEFLLSSLQDVLGKELGQLIAWFFCLILILGVAAPLFLVMRAATNLRSRRDDLLSQDPVVGSLNPVISPQSDADPIISSPSSARPVILPQSSSPELQSHNDITRQNVARESLASYRSLVIAIVGITIAGAFFSQLAKPGNGLALAPIMLFAFAVAIVGHMGKLRQFMTSRPSINIRQKVIVGEPISIKLDNDALQKMRDLVSAGKDMDAVCRELEPAYANWGYIQQGAFRRALEIMLKRQP